MLYIADLLQEMEADRFGSSAIDQPSAFLTQSANGYKGSSLRQPGLQAFGRRGLFCFGAASDGRDQGLNAFGVIATLIHSSA